MLFLDDGQLEPRELVLIGGPYKSGTSRLCEMIEWAGYSNPAYVTSVPEYGHGISETLYLTRECAMARAWNRRLIRAGCGEQRELRRELAAYLVDMFQEIGPKVVIKDPYMKMTAVHWFDAARYIGVRNFRMMVTVRDRGEIARSWGRSRFLSGERERFAYEFRGLLNPMPQFTLDYLRHLEVKLSEVAYTISRGSLRAKLCLPASSPHQGLEQNTTLNFC